jgi:hypothetical protein
MINHGNPEAMKAMVNHVRDILPRAQVTPMLGPGKISLF